MQISPKTIRVFEYEKLTIHDQHRSFNISRKDLQSLYHFNDINNNKYFTSIRDGIKFTHHVGVIQVGNLTIEILSKADRSNVNSLEEYTRWRGVLIDMLVLCKHINVDSLQEANLKKGRTSILDIYFKLYLQEVKELISKGLFKKYKAHTDNISYWKGSLNFSQHLQKNLITKDKFYTTHQIYSKDHLVNSILKKALSIIKSTSTNNTILSEVKQLDYVFDTVSDKHIIDKDFLTLNPSRKLKPYNEALRLAKLIIGQYTPQIKSGGTKLLALLFDMNKLWEEYIYIMLLRSDKTNYTILSQRSKNFWDNKVVKPDIVLINKSTDKTYIIDTKWKVIDNNKPSDADLKQMYVYNMYWDAKRSMLLYPTNTINKEHFGVFHKGRDGDNLCKLGFINILNDKGKLDKGIGNLILDKLS